MYMLFNNKLLASYTFINTVNEEVSVSIGINAWSIIMISITYRSLSI